MGRFRRLHEGRRLFVLPNAWDAVSARLFETSSFPAVGTTSAGVALAHGRPDGEHITAAEMVTAVGRIVRAVSLPVSADIESGYSQGSEGIGETVRQIIEVGAVGINLEDGDPADRTALVPTEVASARVAEARSAADSAGVALFINARVDVYLRSTGDPEHDFEIAVTRARAYAAAGADSIFTIGAADLTTIRQLTRAIVAPLNVMVAPGIPSIPELRSAGVTRLSLGSAAMLATLGLLRRVGAELLHEHSYTSLFDGPLTYREANGLFAGQQEGPPRR